MISTAGFAASLVQQDPVVAHAFGDGVEERPDVHFDGRLRPGERIAVAVTQGGPEQLGLSGWQFDLPADVTAADGFELLEDLLGGEGLETVGMDEFSHGKYRAPSGPPRMRGA